MNYIFAEGIYPQAFYIQLGGNHNARLKLSAFEFPLIGVETLGNGFCKKQSKLTLKQLDMFLLASIYSDLLLN